MFARATTMVGLLASFLLVAAVAAPGPADAAAVCSGATCASLSAAVTSGTAEPETEVDLRVAVTLTGPAESAVLRTHLGSMTGDSTSVQVNGTAAAAKTVSDASGGNLVIDLGGNAPLVAGTVVVTFTANPRYARTAPPFPTSTFSVDFAQPSGDDPATATSAAVTVPPAAPDLSVSSLTNPLGRGTDGDVLIDVADVGVNSAAQDATATVTLPAGIDFRSATLTSDVDDNSHPACTTAGRSVTCPIHTSKPFGDADLDLRVHVADSLAVGSHPAVTATVNPVGLADENPADNTAHFRLVIQGRADLLFTEHVPTHKLVAGTTVTVTATVLNRGPDPAVDVLLTQDALVHHDGDAVIRQTDGTVLIDGRAAQLHLSRLAPGASAHLSLRVTAKRVGAVVYVVTNGDAEGSTDPTFQCADRACNGAANTTMTIVAAPKAHSGSSASSAPSASGSASADPVAATGTAADGQLGVGLGVLALGALLCLAGRRPRAS